MVMQEEWVDGKVKTLGQGPHWMTILSAPPNPLPSRSTPLLLPLASIAVHLHPLLPANGLPLPCVLKLALVCLSSCIRISPTYLFLMSNVLLE